MNNTSTGRPRQFLADLADAMRTTAEAERLATIERCQANAKAYIEHLNSQTNADAASLQQAAVADISAIREGSRSTVERTRKETERRILERQELMEQELQECAAAAESEAERVQQRVRAYEEELARSFEQLAQITDPTDFANLASEMPGAPAFGEPDPAALVHEFRLRRA
ncbi:MAG: hypothetical protein ACXWN4_07665 [Candidatus Limnocylindrales bacterium]